MAEQAMLVILLAVFAFGLVSRLFERAIVTPPMVFLLLGWAFAGVAQRSMLDLGGLLDTVAGITLVVVLFADGTEIDLRGMRAARDWPARLLLVALPVSMVGTTLAGLALLPGWPIWEVALLAVLLCPTDAALSRAVVTDPRVPRPVRDTLAVESGLNDGIALPIALFLGCAAVGGQHDFAQENWFAFALEQITYGALAGVVFGLAGGWTLARAEDAGLCAPPSRGLAALALAGAAYLGAQEIGGNGLIAAFVAGAAYGSQQRGRSGEVDAFLEGEGQLFSIAAFFLIGAVLLPDGIANLDWEGGLLIAACLGLVRPAATWLAMRGSGTTPALKLFLGWFGPRGLATALFGVMIFDMISLERGDEILGLTAVAVLASAVLHGITAAPAARISAGWLMPGRGAGAEGTSPPG